MNDNFSELKDAEKSSRANDNNKIFAAVLILVGAVLLVNYVTDYSLENWWALFMLIPAGYIFVKVWRDYKEDGRLSHQSSSAIIPGVIILTMIAIFLFNLSWAIFWPISIIAVGLSIFLGNC